DAKIETARTAVEGKGDALRIVEPAEALRRLNITMTKNAGDQARFATAAYAIHDKRDNTITVAGAGHPPSLLVRAGTGEVEQIESQGPLLGVFAELEFGQTTHQLNPGDVFIIYSDGFEVAFPKHDAEGDERKRPTLTYIQELTDAGSGEHALEHAIATLESHLDAQSGIPRGIGVELIELSLMLDATPKRRGSQAPVLILVDSESSDMSLNRMIDALSEHLCPALVLIPESHAQSRLMFQSAGIMCELDDIDPAQAAVILWTLAQRQPAIQQLANELMLTELSINSVNSEMLKLHEELASAASIQREYMPKAIPEIEGIDMGIVYRPASYVSGDIYDIVELDEHHTGFFLADA
ncbi:MAG TPA: hypothetical protein EYO33_01375, partial [Phycisphaerales bacterium]|nr:hypothetical protein [Phycisphaerales bacterium]